MFLRGKNKRLRKTPLSYEATLIIERKLENKNSIPNMSPICKNDFSVFIVNTIKCYLCLILDRDIIYTKIILFA